MSKVSKLVLCALIACMFSQQQASAWSLKQAPLMTEWADEVDPQNTLPEYPRPQMVRDNWQNLNGVWEFQPGSEGDQVPAGQTLSGDILVPFPVESAISGVKEHHERVWYKRTFQIPESWDGSRILLHFGAVDWESEVYVNGQSAGVHKGGFDTFSYDITSMLDTEKQAQELIVRVYDPTNSSAIACGKQDLNPNGIWYTAVTGIWQTVWLEPVPQTSVEKLNLTPDVDSSCLNLSADIDGSGNGVTVHAAAYANGKKAGEINGAPGQKLSLNLRDPQLWSPSNPFLYDLTVQLKKNGSVIDEVESYFGMRKIEVKKVDGKNRILLNGDFVFNIGPLDQGWWPDGLFTAPTDEALKYDLDMTKEFGFNMTRKHVKIEPARWYYWCDKLGLMVWQDMPSMRSSGNAAQREQFEKELASMVDDLGNHPSIVLWVVFNEGWGQYDTVRVTEDVMEQDPSRIVTCASGWTDHEVGHIKDDHRYSPPHNPSAPTDDRASVCGEYGGIGMRVEGHMWEEDSWSYTMAETGEELERIYDSYIQTLVQYREDPGYSGAVYTQITDVEGEINGLITYDRKVVKPDPADIAFSNKMYERTYQQILPTSAQTPQTWKYSFSDPGEGWQNPAFDDSSWQQGHGGFGTESTPGAVIGTVWDSSDIWLRKSFEVGQLTDEQIEKLIFRIHHDEDVEVYVNGSLVFSEDGFTTNYLYVNAGQELKNAIQPGQTNTIAVHCYQDTGGQYIDVGIAFETTDFDDDSCGQLGYAPSDFNRDCNVDMSDMLVFVEDWLGSSSEG
ncbi:Beta-galactosidase [Sedimentisphaera cyanobacteriorum]|uniref:Beta-galactosidase n=1 Tax=Sedimentisphaera cyanobacteriorum TaxID=1940790 RepID=A0A1Q2HN78_9BACT|nr:glycoside hydrolase family 2 [Sedimentisphaera cyanobacteriorum]AQQ08666.1 Beta-galactosidase [Sedimentisphaera cyanobacteriorum]